MRKLEKSFAPPSVIAPALETKDYEFVTITPMFGGGTVAAEIDEDRPVHVTSIRGSLREWWRRLYGEGRHNEELFKAESCIWGATDQASVVKVELVSVTAPEKITIAEIKPNKKGNLQIFMKNIEGTKMKYPQYALFPFQGELPKPREGKPGKDPAVGWKQGLKFKLCVTYNFSILARDEHGNLLITADQVKEQVEKTLTAWANFGGVGTRTRRGLGALFCEELAFKDELAASDFVKQFLTPNDCVGMISSDTQQDNSLLAWVDVVDTMRYFRQEPGFARTKREDEPTPGRSFWPEPDSIRRLTKQWSYLHDPENKIEAFPRARFGMPIVFHFKDEKDGDPKETMLLPSFDGEEKPRTRMSSPVLLRPIKFKSTKYYRAIVLLFPVPDFDCLELQRNNSTIKKITDSTVVSNLEDDTKSPLCRFSEGDSVKAFAKFLRENKKYKNLKEAVR